MHDVERMASFSGTKKITQATFDEVVKENMDEFEMDLQEATADAVKQFTSQAVDLSDIDLSGGVGKQEVLDAIGKLLVADDEEIVRALTTLASLCNEKHELSKRNVILMRTEGGLNALHTILRFAQNTEVLVKSMRLLESVSAQNIDNRDFFEPGGSKLLGDVLKPWVSKIDTDDSAMAVMVAGLTLARCVARSENNKVMLFRNGMDGIVVQILSASVAACRSASSTTVDRWTEVTRAACNVMKGLSVADDFRKDMSCAHDNGKYFLASNNTVDSLMGLSQDFRNRPTLASAALSAARNLVTTEEAVQIMVMHGAMSLPLDILGYPEASLPLVRSVLGFMRNLCADDVRKEKLVYDGSMALMVAAMSEGRFADDAALVEHGAACLAAMSLRSPSNSARIVECGAIEVLVKCMRRHSDRVAFQRQGCLAIRNIAARCPELRAILLDAGVEGVLRDAGKFRDSVDEAYAALRDLNCEVQFVKITEDGRVEEAYEQFGGAKKLNFRAVYDDTDDIVERVQNEARAPFADEMENLKPFAANGARTADMSGHDHQHSHSHEGGCCDK